jgi:hypothetical protein
MTIYTDSKAAIELIQKTLLASKARAWLKSSNTTILAAIKEAVHTKNLNLVLQKVKAHSGNALNDRADRVAKDGTKDNSPNDIAEISTRGFVYKPLWQNTLIEVPVRGFIKKLTNTIYKAEWTFFKANADEIHRSRTVDKDWSLFRALLQKFKKAQSRTIAENQKRIFAIRSINRALPTLEKRSIQRPDLYPTTVCTKCKKSNESFEHLTSCPRDIEKWEEGERNIIANIWNDLETKEKRNLSLDTLRRAVIPDNSQEKEQWRQKLARGIMRPKCKEDLQILGFSASKAKKILVYFLENWFFFFQREIWKSRCKKVIEWEKSHKITQKVKKTKRRRKEKEGTKSTVVQSVENRLRKHESKEEAKWPQILKLSLNEIQNWIKKGEFSPWNRG